MQVNYAGQLPKLVVHALTNDKPLKHVYLLGIYPSGGMDVSGQCFTKNAHVDVTCLANVISERGCYYVDVLTATSPRCPHQYQHFINA